MITDFYDTPNLAAIQYMDGDFAKRLDKMIGTWFMRDPDLAKKLDRALHVARCELDQYEEWLCAQERIDPASWIFDEDVPW